MGPVGGGEMSWTGRHGQGIDSRRGVSDQHLRQNKTLPDSQSRRRLLVLSPLLGTRVGVRTRDVRRKGDTENCTQNTSRSYLGRRRHRPKGGQRSNLIKSEGHKMFRFESRTQ